MKLFENEALNTYSYINIGGTAKYLIIVYTLKDILDAIKFSTEQKLKYRVVGSGSNIFFNDYYDGVIIINKYTYVEILDSCPIIYTNTKTTTKLISVGSGMVLLDLIKYCSKNNYNMSELAGIPGTIGGAVYNNAGAYGKEMSDYFQACTYIDTNLEIKLFKREDLEFKYRTSFLKEGLEKENIILLNVYLEIPTGKDLIIDKNINDIIAVRNSKLPSVNNIGCIFKNILLSDYKLIVGKMLEDIGANQMTYKNLRVSKHANIIINESIMNESINNESRSDPSDLLYLIDMIKNKFMNHYGIPLCLEVEII